MSFCIGPSPYTSKEPWTPIASVDQAGGCRPARIAERRRVQRLQDAGRRHPGGSSAHPPVRAVHATRCAVCAAADAGRAAPVHRVQALRGRGRARRHEPCGPALPPDASGAWISPANGIFFSRSGPLMARRRRRGKAAPQAPRPPAAGSPERRCAPGRVERRGAVRTVAGKGRPCRESGTTSSAGRLRLGRRGGKARHDGGAADPRRTRIGLRRRTNRAAVARAGPRPRSRTVTRNRPRSGGPRHPEPGPVAGVARRAAGGRKRRVGDGRSGASGRACGEREAGVAPGAPGGTARDPKRHAESTGCVSIQGARDRVFRGRFDSR